MCRLHRLSLLVLGPVLCLSPVLSSLWFGCPWSRGLARVNPPASQRLVWAAFLFYSPS